MKVSWRPVCAVLAGGALLFAGACTESGPVSPLGKSSDADGRGVSSSRARGGEESRTYFGPTVPFGGGVARAWVEIDPEGIPLSVGLDLTENALRHHPSEVTEFTLPLHKKAGVTPFTHVYLGYNPAGHEPPGVYDLEHFDVHFYMTSVEEREAIGPTDSTEFATAPDAIYLPPLYLQVPGGVPQMGAHWVDLLAPEFNGGEFTRTFVWGSYDGEVTFLEPMTTVSYLESHPDETIPIRQPEAYQEDGYYPLNYSIRYLDHPGTFRIALEDLTYHVGR